MAANLGIAFQIADDVLDIWGEERVTGKSLGTDLEKQKLTLPVIYLLRLRRARRRRRRPPAALARPRPIIAGTSGLISRRTGALDHAWQLAKQHVKQALDALDCLPDSDAKVVLRILAQYVVRRSS